MRGAGIMLRGRIGLCEDGWVRPAVNGSPPRWYTKAGGCTGLDERFDERGPMVGKAIMAAVGVFACSCAAQPAPRVGPAGSGGGMVVPTEQIIRPAGKSLAYHGRPVDLAVSPDGKTVYAKSSGSLLVIDAASWTIRQELKYPASAGGASMHG